MSKQTYGAIPGGRHEQADLQPDPTMPQIDSTVYCISPKATSFEVQTLIEEKLLQLDAFLSMAYGETGASFRMQPESLQDQYLWGCSRMATEVRELYYTLLSLR
jgi:hypothetical protein